MRQTDLIFNPKGWRICHNFQVDELRTKHEHKPMNQWPRTIPFDLKKRLEALREYRSAPSVQSEWGEIFDWLEKHGVEPPEHPLPTEPELGGPVGHV